MSIETRVKKLEAAAADLPRPLEVLSDIPLGEWTEAELEIVANRDPAFAAILDRILPLLSDASIMALTEDATPAALAAVDEFISLMTAAEKETMEATIWQNSERG